MLAENLKKVLEGSKQEEPDLNSKEEYSELEKLAKNYYEKKEQIKKYEKELKKSRKEFLKYVGVGKKVDLDNVGLEVSVVEKTRTNMDEDKLKGVLKDLVEKNPQISDVITEEKIVKTTIHQDKLQRYLEEGLIDNKKILPCITEKKSSALYVKKLKK